MALKAHALGQLNVENIDIQATLRGNLRVKLPQRTGGGVSGVGKQGLSLFLLPGVQLFEALFRHKYLAADNEPGGGVFQRHGNGTDGFQIFCHVLAHIPVPPGGAPDKDAVHIFQGHGQSVDLWLHGKPDIRLGGADLSQKLIEFFHAEHVLKAHEGHRMGHLLKLAQGLASHPLGGRIGSGQLRMRIFQILQLPQEVVIFKILHLRIVQDIVVVVGFF